MVTTRGAKKRQDEQEKGIGETGGTKSNERMNGSDLSKTKQESQQSGGEENGKQEGYDEEMNSNEDDSRESDAEGTTWVQEDDTDQEEMGDVVAWSKRYLSQSWIVMNVYGKTVNYTIKSTRLTTMHWYSMPYEHRVRCTGFMAPVMKFEWAAITQAVNFAIKRFGIEDEIDLGWKMARGVGKDVQKKKFENDWEVAAMIDVCMRFSKTSLEFVESLAEGEKEKQEYKAFWIAANQTFGCNIDESTERRTIFQLSKTKPMDSVWWDRYKHYTDKKFEAIDFNKVGPKNPWKVMDAVNCRNGAAHRCWNVDEWELVNKIVLSDPNPDQSEHECIRFYVQLANTPPENIPGWNFATRSLMNNPFSMAWVAVHNIWGRTWQREVRFDNSKKPEIKTPLPKPPTKRRKKGKKDKKVKRRPVPKVLYVSRDNTETKEYKLEDKWKRLYTTFIKIKLPPIPAIGNYNQLADEKVADFNEALQTIWSVDPSMIVPAWLEFVEKDPLHKDSTLHENRAFIAPFVERFYGSRSKGGSYIRTKICHDLPLSELWGFDEIKNMKEEREIAIYEDKIQARKVKYLGWWAGSINSRQAIGDLEWTLKNQPLAVENNIKNIEIRIGIVNNEDTFRQFDENDRVFAMQLYCEEEHAVLLHEIVVALYPAKPQSTYPLGRHMRFVSNVNENDFFHAPDAFEKAEILRKKQGIFLSRLRTVSTRSIRKLHRELAVKPYASLTEIIMAWRSPLFPQEKLFVAVEEQYGVTTFHFLKKNARVAKLVVPILEIILEKEFGMEVKEWFETPAHRPKKRYTYSPQTRQVTPVQHVKRSEEWNVGVEDSESEISEGEIFHVEVGNIDLQPQEFESPLDDASVGTLGMIRKEEDEEESFSSDDEDKMTDQSSVTASLVTREQRDKPVEKKREEKETDAETGMLSVTASIVTKSSIPSGSRPTEKPKEEARSGNESDESSVTMSLVTTASSHRKRKSLITPPHKQAPPAKPPEPVDDASTQSSVTASIATRLDAPPIVSPAAKIKVLDTNKSHDTGIETKDTSSDQEKPEDLPSRNLDDPDGPENSSTANKEEQKTTNPQQNK